jgi:preprotein translocase subunit SecF
MSRLGNLGGALYRGEVSYDFVGRQKRWYAISGVLLLVSVLALIFRPLQLGIEFRGGAEFLVSGASCSVEEARGAVGLAGVSGEVRVQTIGADTIRVQTAELTQREILNVKGNLVTSCEVAEEDVSSTVIGPSWGSDISQKALRGLVIFLILVAVYLALAFEWKMAAAALAALLHDLVITVGIYALAGFEVTPATVIGLLTILGYSLYDTVVVFDKVRENTRGLQGGSRMTYSQAANLAVNQTLVRSINTTVIALLPVAAILFVGAGLLGAGTLKDLALALFVGIAAGAYSSIFIATPLLADLKEREPAMKALAKRVKARGAAPAAAGPKAASRKQAVSAAAAGDSVQTAALDEDSPPPDNADPTPAPVSAPAPSAQGAQKPRSGGTGGNRNQPRRPSSNAKRRPGGKKRR